MKLLNTRLDSYKKTYSLCDGHYVYFSHLFINLSVDIAEFNTSVGDCHDLQVFRYSLANITIRTI